MRKRPWHSLSSSNEDASVRRGCALRLLLHRLHHLQHSLLHLFSCRLSLVRTHHPRVTVRVGDGAATVAPKHVHHGALAARAELGRLDRKSTRLNSSHMSISYAV